MFHKGQVRTHQVNTRFFHGDFPRVSEHCKILTQSVTKNSTEVCCAIPSSPMGNSLGFYQVCLYSFFCKTMMQSIMVGI